MATKTSKKKARKKTEAPSGVFLQFSGEHYMGDGLHCHDGDVVEVSEEKAKQLRRDFPKDWKKVARSPKNKMMTPKETK